jgi:redox-sensitive bicupin YhaK (pirin superfamily)
MTTRDVRLIREPVPTLEGAGVHLRRVFGHGDEALFDPFLMLDDFRGEHPTDYEAGFPWHPHRGIETITYMLEGECDHGDSLGNSGTICAGDVQWMTAGGGIIHEEMPRGAASGRMGGFQLWANLPAVQKMRGPRYQGVEAAQIPEVVRPGATIRVIAGRVGDTVGPVRDVTVEPEYLDVTLAAGAVWTHPTARGHTVFVYLFGGDALVGASKKSVSARPGVLVLFDDGDDVTVTAGAAGARFLLVSGLPLREPVAWRGPIVMNTREELDQAWTDLEAGTFVKRGA